MTTIRVSLTPLEAEALLAHVTDGAFGVCKAHDFDPHAFLRARSKLIEKLLDLPDYVPPAHREHAAKRPRVTA